MKVKQVVSEHKKGVRARIYNKKATTKAQGTVPLYGPDKQEAKLKPVKISENPMPGQSIGKVQQVNPDGTAVIQSTDGNTQTVQQTQLQQGDNNKLSMQVPKITPGQEVDASKTIEEEPTNDPQMDQMKQLMSQAKTPWEKRHWEERIKIRQNQGDTVDIGGGLPVQGNGQLLPVEPDIMKWIQKNPTYAKDMPYDALPPGMKQPGIVDQGISRLKQLINYK